jgi:hypothetical protein
MTIYVKPSDSSGFEVVSGSARLKAQLHVQGWSKVLNIKTGEEMEVHEVGDKLIALSPKALEAIRMAASEVIVHAAQP